VAWRCLGFNETGQTSLQQAPILKPSTQVHGILRQHHAFTYSNVSEKGIGERAVDEHVEVDKLVIGVKVCALIIEDAI
jgi:hypothetical protein